MAKLKRGKGKVKPLKRGFPWLWVIVALFIAVFAVVFWHVSASNNPPNSPNLKAAIVDPLYNLQPNEAFIVQITQYLEGYGFKVELYKGGDVTVDLCRKLPTHEY